MIVRTLCLAFVLGLVAAACGGSSEGVASLADTDASPGMASSTTLASPADIGDATEEPDTEQSLLDLAACMRAEGIDMEDPQIGSDGNFRLGAIIRQVSDADPEDIRAAMDACSEHIQGVTLGFRDFDITELQDQMLDFARCMRDNGFDMPDPDFSAFVPRGGGGSGAGPFGDIDPQDPTFESAFGSCQDVLGFGRFGTGGGRPGAGGDNG